VETAGNKMKGYVNDELLVEYEAGRPLTGHVGLWTKADSVTYFETLEIRNGQNIRTIEF
jgi:hypothetical protein